MAVTDLVVAVFFLCGLTLVARFRGAIAAHSRSSYRNISAGLALLSLASLMGVYYRLELFASFPVLSEPVFFRLVNWTGIILGICLLVYGVSSWLPLARHDRKINQSRNRRLEFCRRIEQLVGVESRIPTVLQTTLERMVNCFDLDKGLVYAYSAVRARWYLVGTAGSLVPRERVEEGMRTGGADTPGQMVPDAVWECEQIDPATMPFGRPTISLPVEAESHQVARFLLWSKGKTALEGEDRVNLKTAMDVIGRRIALNAARAKIRFVSEMERFRRALGDCYDNRKRLKENLPEIYRLLSQVVPANRFCLILAKGDSCPHRWSIGSSGTVLAEVSSGIVHNSPLWRDLAGTGEVVTRVSEQLTCSRDSLIGSAEWRSLLAVPLCDGRRVKGAVLFTSVGAARYRSLEIAHAKACQRVLERLVFTEGYRLSLERHDESLSAIRTLLQNIREAETLSELFQFAADTLSRQVRTSLVRISTVDEGDSFLRCRALCTLRPLENASPLGASLVLRLMPYHRLVLESGRPMLVNQAHRESRMSEAEMNQAFSSGMRSALLVPVKVGEHVLAIISMGEMRGWERFRYRQRDIRFTATVASVLSAGMALKLKRSVAPRSRLHEPGMWSTDGKVRSRVKSSLTGILGSVELLKSRSGLEDDNLRHYLDIIDTSARRIGECVAPDGRP